MGPVRVFILCQVPHELHDNISEIKTGVEQFTLSTKSIAKEIHKLSEHVTSCVENINDRLTALGMIGELLKFGTSDSLKINFDQMHARY